MLKDETIIEKLLKIKRIFTDLERNKKEYFTNSSDSNFFKEDQEEIYYLISCTWCHKASAFIEELTNKYSMRNTGDLFEINKFISKFTIFENETRKITNTYGIYPGPINNFSLLKGKDSWFDGNNNSRYSNVFVSKNLKDNHDYFILNKDHWNLINEVFGNLYEIKRIGIPKSLDIEIYPKEVMPKNIIKHKILKSKTIAYPLQKIN